MPKPPLTIYLAAPRGFCAGVDRAIKIVEMALEKWGAPVYVRHEIVHNRFVVDDLRAKGAVFVEELDDCPDDRPVIFSAHGVPKAVPAEAARREMIYVDATCPLVSKVHIEAARHHENGLQMIMIGHAGHPETIGTMGQLPEGEVLLVETVQDVAHRRGPRSRAARLRHADDAVGRRHRRHRRGASGAVPRHRRPAQGRHLLCHHQPAGGGQGHGAHGRRDAGGGGAQLLQLQAAGGGGHARRLPLCAARPARHRHRLARARGDRDVGITAGASAPEVLVDEVIDAFRDRYDVTVELVETAKEDVEFKVPRVLRIPA
jgi:4-hydroxy-3-methylbut-2-en-1-yl diphosphate reductase